MAKKILPSIIVLLFVVSFTLLADESKQETESDAVEYSNKEDTEQTEAEPEFEPSLSIQKSVLGSVGGSSSTSGASGQESYKGIEQVGSSGAFTYSYPIELPPGTNGMAPSLSLSYNSMAGNGMLGMGFSLTGLPVISRDSSYPVKFDASDHYLYEGQKLFYGSDGRYHTERENFVRIQAYNLNSSSSHWEVTMKNGTKLYFGNTTDSHIDAVGKSGKARLWALNKVQDIHGNYYDMEYLEDTANGDYYPLRITYTKGNGLTKYRTVEFSYETRSDHGQMYVPTLVDTNLRLKWITVKADGSLVRKYRLDYENGGSTGRSRITAIQEYGSDGNAPAAGEIGSYNATGQKVPEVVLDWNWPSHEIDYWADTNIRLYSDLDNTIFQDFNGDGRTDMGFHHENNNLWIAYGTENGLSWWIDTGVRLYTTIPNIVFRDFNGDGKTDMGFHHENNNLWIAYGTENGMIWWKDTGVRLYTKIPNIVFQDFNGDGKCDMGFKHADNSNLWIAYGTENGMIWWKDTVVRLYTKIPNIVFSDFNGDGKTDMGFHHENNNLWIAYGTEYGMNWWVDTGVRLYTTILNIVFRDFNGDGKTDMGFHHENNNLWIAYGTENGMIWWKDTGVRLYTTIPNIVFQDFNGDGKCDMGFKHADNSNLWIAYGIENGMIWWKDTVVRLYTTIPNIVFQDFNGDGKCDMGFKHADNYNLWIAYSSYMYNSLSITLPSGGTISVTYAPAPQVPGAVVPASSSYPLVANKSPRSLVTKLEYNDGFGNITEKRYEYKNGLMYMGRPHERADLGFQVFREKVKQPDGSFITSETEFQYGSSAAEKKIYAGLAKRQAAYGSDGKKYVESRSYYGADTTTTAGVRFLHPTQTISLNYNGETTSDANAVKTLMTYEFSTHGDSTRVVNWGEINSDWLDILQDRTETITEYAVDINKWLFVPSKRIIKAYDLNGNYGVASEDRFLYYADSSGRDFGQTISPSGSPGGRGLLAKIEHENNDKDTSQQFAYYTNGNLWKTKDALGTVAQTITYDPNYATKVYTVKNALGQTVTTIYDALLRPVEMKDAAGVSQYVRYDVFSRVIAAWGPGDSDASPTKRYSYFNIAALPASPSYVQEEVKNSSNDYLITRTYLDGFGRTLQSKMELETAGQYCATDVHYDSAGRGNKTSLPYVSTNINFNYSGERGSSARKYSITDFDTIGRAYRSTTPDGNKSHRIYLMRYQADVDAEGRVSAVTAIGNERYSYTYNTLNYSGYSYGSMVESFSLQKDSWYRQVRTRTARDGSIIAERSKGNNNENVITVKTDMLGQKTSYVDPDKGLWTYQYDLNGNLIYQRDAKGNIIRFEYDVLNRPTNKKHDTTTVSTYAYTFTGNLSSVSYVGGSDTFSYTPRNEVNGMSRTIAGYGTKSMAMTYDSMGRIASMTYPDGELVTHTYNAGGNLEAMAGASVYVSNIDYTEYGNIKILSFGNGKTTTYGYDPLNGRMTSLSVPGVMNYGYTYDKVGNIKIKTDNLNSTYTENYGYDALYRLTSALGGGYGSKAYSYDAYNNMTSKDGKYYTYPTVGGTRPHAVIYDGTNSYAYDANGNMTSGKGRAYAYDHENRVSSITMNGVATSFAYDDSGERVKKTSGATTTLYWFGSYEETYVGGTKTEAVKYYSANGMTVAQRSSASGLLYLHKDHLGSFTKLTDASGVMKQTIGYVPYGTEAFSSGGTYTAYKYTGQEQDTSTGLYYYHARYYDPDLGRFLQADTVLDGMNRYTYCGNNPVMYTDPTGEFAWFIPVLIGAAVGAYVGGSASNDWEWDATKWDYTNANTWYGMGAGAFVGALGGSWAAAGIGATGVSTSSVAWGVTTSVIEGANISMGLYAGTQWASGGDITAEGLFKNGMVGGLSAGFSASGGFGLLYATKNAPQLAKTGAGLLAQAIGTFGRSVGLNWANSQDPFSSFYVGVGPVNIAFRNGGLSANPLDWLDANAMNVATNAIGSTNLAFGGKIGWDWASLSPKYSDGFFPGMYNNIFGGDATGAYVLAGRDQNRLNKLLTHEYHHIWQSRMMGSGSFMPSYYLHRAVFGYETGWWEILAIGGKWFK